MVAFAANLTLLFPELPFLDRFEAAAEAGFDAVEVLFPYDDPVPDIRARLAASGLPLILMNCPPPNYTGGPRGMAAVPGAEDRFRHDFTRVLRYAAELRPRFIHVMAGAAEGAAAKDTFIANLAWAAAQAPAQRLTVEPLNLRDNPGYFLADYDLAAEVIDAVGAPNLGLQYDAFHAQMLTGDAMAVWRAQGHCAVHVQVSDTPDRAEPWAGGVDFDTLFAAIRDDGYSGVISAEYLPKGGTRAGLGWLARARAIFDEGKVA